MSRPLGLIALSVVVALLAGCAPSYEGVTPAEFASVACTEWSDTEAADALARVRFEPDGTGEEQHARAVAMAEEVIAEWDRQRDAIAAAQPAVADGAEIIGLFTAYYDSRSDAARAVLDDFRGSSTDVGDGYDVVNAADLLFFDVASANSAERNPFMQIDDQDVVEALLADDVCLTFLEERGW